LVDDRLGRALLGQGEAAGGGDVADALVGPLGVVVADPAVESGLELVDGGGPGK
jgi:hypothetical protein